MSGGTSGSSGTYGADGRNGNMGSTAVDGNFVIVLTDTGRSYEDRYSCLKGGFRE